MTDHRFTIVLCRGCRAETFFALTVNGNRMLVDAEPDPNGNLVVTPASGGRDALPAVEVVTRGQAAGMRAAGKPLYTSHFASCPRASEFRRR